LSYILASRTQEPTVEIQEIIEHLQQGTNSAVTAMDKGIGEQSIAAEDINQNVVSIDNLARQS